MDPIATYAERRFDARRKFMLYSDRITVAGSNFFAVEFQLQFELKSLDPNWSAIRIRHRLFFAGILWASVSWVLALFLWPLFKSELMILPLGGLGFVGLIGALLSLATIRKVEFASFRARGGATVLDVARSGPDAARFTEFVELLAGKIREAATETGSSPG